MSMNKSQVVGLIKALGGTGTGGTSTGSSIPTPTGANQQLVTDASGVMTWESIYTVVLEETTIATSGEGGEYTFATPFAVSLEAGAVYKVTYNGTEYECTAVEIGGTGNMGMGKLSMIDVDGGNDDAPFILAQVSADAATEDMTGMVVDLSGLTSVTFSVVDTGKRGTQPGVNFVVNVTMNASSGTFNDCTADKTFEQVVAALDEGKNVVCYLRDNNNSSMAYVLRVVAYAESEVMFCACMALSEVDASLYLIYKSDSLTGAMRYLS